MSGASESEAAGDSPSARSAGGKGRVQILTVGLCVIAVLLTLLAVAPLHRLASPGEVPWWVLAPMFFMAEVCVVHIQFRREAHSFSLSELPLVAGLFFASPLTMVLSNIGGTAVALVFHRRQSPLKVAFNLANFAAGTCLAATLFIGLADPSHPLGNRSFIAATVAVVAGAAFQVLVILAAISLSEGRLEASGIASTFGLALAGTMVNACVALISVWIFWQDPTLAWLLAVPISGILVGYRVYVSEREKRDQVDFLYESSRQLHHTEAVDEALASLLTQARDMFRSEVAEIAFFPSRDREAWLRTSVDRDGKVVSMSPHALDQVEHDFTEQLLANSPLILHLAGVDDSHDAYLRRRGLRDAMAVVLRGEHGPLGTMLFGNRLGEVTSFDDEDLRLLEMLADQTGSLLEKGRLQHNLSQLTELQQQLQHQALHDPLTGMANRLLFRTRVNHAITKPSGKIGVLLIDLDDFKTVNDSLGHGAGDDLLCAVAGRIDRCLRPGDVAARLGGDEFAVLVASVEDANGATRVAERIIAALRDPFVLEDEAVLIHASIGVVVASTGPDRTAEELLLNADVAMYGAKTLGKGRWELFSPAMHEAVRVRHRLKADLHRAVANGEFEVVYQPIVDVPTGATVAAEALLRWRHPRRGVVMPMEFLGLAEETALILPIGAWVLTQACCEATRWPVDPQRGPVAVAVNVAARQLKQRSFVSSVRAALESSGLAPTRLILEVTETDIIDDPDPIILCLSELRLDGVRVAIDDFGTGHSSLGRLRDFPVDVLKIDKSFTAALTGSDQATDFARAVFSFGTSLGLRVVAEGVETPEQLPSLVQLRCDWAQGFHFAHPLSPAAMRASLDFSPKLSAAV